MGRKRRWRKIEKEDSKDVFVDPTQDLLYQNSKTPLGKKMLQKAKQEDEYDLSEWAWWNGNDWQVF